MNPNQIPFKEYQWIIDSNAFITETNRDFMKTEMVEQILAYREESGENYLINIPATVFEELERLKQREGVDKLGLRTNALRGYDAAKDLVLKGIARKIKSDFTGAANGFNDVAMLTMLMQLRLRTNIVVLTDDRKFARDLMAINAFQSVSTKNVIRVFFINNKSKKLQEWMYDKPSDQAYRFKGELAK